MDFLICAKRFIIIMIIAKSSIIHPPQQCAIFIDFPATTPLLISPDPKTAKFGTRKSWRTGAYSLPSALSSRYTLKKQEAGVKLKIQDVRLFNLVFESDAGWILDFSNRTLSAFLMKSWTLILMMNVIRRREPQKPNGSDVC